MNSTQRLTIAGGFVVLSGAVSILTAPTLPDQLLIHWNAAGEPDGTMATPLALVLFPALSAVLLGLLIAIPRIDPLRENVEAFRPYYDWFVVLFAGFLFAIHVGIVAFNLGYEFDFTLLVLGGTAVLFYYIGVLLSHAERNWFVGIRTPWTLSSEEVWNRTNHLGGRLFKLTAVIAAVGLLAGEYAIYFLLVPLLLVVAITVAYSYYCYEHLERGEASSGDASS